MRTDHVSLGSYHLHRAPFRGHRPTGACFARTFFVTLFLMSGSAMVPSASKAGIIYTWHEDDGQSITGSMAVKSTVQAAGEITFADVTSFTFTFNVSQVNESFQTNELEALYFPLPISTTDASPLGFINGVTIGAQSGTTGDNFYVAFSVFWDTNSGELWQDYNITTQALVVTGYGHWTITGATTPSAVPEPSAAIMGVIGTVGGIAIVLGGKRRSERR